MLKKDKLDILYEDKDLIAVNKPYGLLTISDNNEQENTLFHKLLVFMKQKNKNNKIFVVHRLDRDTSGIVLFAKNQRIKSLLQDNWNELVTLREYCAIVHGKVENDSSKIVSWLKETKTLYTYSSNDKKNGKLAITNYIKMDESNNYSLLKINIETGRKNQIRVHMKDINHPIVGDKKYGIDKGKGRMYLHACSLEFIHPYNKKKVIINSFIPENFINIINNNKK